MVVRVTFILFRVTEVVAISQNVIRQEDTLGSVDIIPAPIATVLLWLVIRVYQITVGTNTYLYYGQLKNAVITVMLTYQ